MPCGCGLQRSEFVEAARLVNRVIFSSPTDKAIPGTPKMGIAPGMRCRLTFGVGIANGRLVAEAIDFPVTIYHNPACGTSRNALAMIRAAGYEPIVVEYLKTGWTRSGLQEPLAAMSARPRDILREKGTPAAELGLLDPAVSDDQILEAMVAHPILVNRPIVVTPRGVKLARPSEVVLTLLDAQPETFTKEDGQLLTPKG
jgi:arsenate reductase